MHSVFPMKTGFSECFIVRGEKTALVDTSISVGEDRFRQIFQQAGIKPEDIKLIIITHGHSDHFAHINYLKQLTGAKVLCHRDAVHAIQTGQNPRIIPRNFGAKIMMSIFRGTLKDYEPVIPDIIIDKDFNLKGYGINGKVLITPGHSFCSISVVINSDEAIIGDTLVGSVFSPQKPRLAAFVVDDNQLKKSIIKVFKTGAGIFYGSHGGPFKRKDVEKLIWTFSKT